MHWLEAVLGVSPDGGNGMAELTLGLALAAVVASGLAVWRVRRRSKAPLR